MPNNNFLFVIHKRKSEKDGQILVSSRFYLVKLSYLTKILNKSIETQIKTSIEVKSYQSILLKQNNAKPLIHFSTNLPVIQPVHSRFNFRQAAVIYCPYSWQIISRCAFSSPLQGGTRYRWHITMRRRLIKDIFYPPNWKLRKLMIFFRICISSNWEVQKYEYFMSHIREGDKKN